MGEVRRRKKKGEIRVKDSKLDNGTDESGRAGEDASTADANSSGESLWKTFSSHPLIQLAPFIMIPYGLYLLYYKMVLQRPDLLSLATLGLIDLRPAVGVTDERQLLVVGTISGGTAQIASDLKEKFGLEIGHEVSDTHWHFVRDGTVSWFHGIRFLKRPVKEEMNESIRKICSRGGQMNMGFHPASYREPIGKCSYRKIWGACWEKECVYTLLKEWGCAEEGKCEINFRRTLHQARNPLRTIESLVVKFCEGGLDGEVSPSFLAYASALFPQHDFSGDSCIESAATFVVEYTNAMDLARKRGEISASYKVEESTPCTVAELAGLAEENSTVYKPNLEKVAAKCSEVLGSATDFIEHSEGQVNKGQVQLGWEDLRGGMHSSKRAKGNTDIEKQVKALFKKLGYDARVEAEKSSFHQFDSA